MSNHCSLHLVSLLLSQLFIASCFFYFFYRRDASIIRTRRDTRSSEWRRSESGKPHISHCSSLKGSNPTSSSNSSRNNNNHLEQQGSIHSSSSHKEANDICEGSSGKNISGISSRTLKMGVLCTEKHDRGERCECEGLPASFPRPPGLHSPAFLQFPCENSTSSSQESVKRALSRKRSLDTSPHDPDDEGSSVIRRRTLRSPSTGSINGIAEHVIDKEKLSLDIAAIVNQNGVKSEPGLNGIKIVHGYQNGTRPLCCVGLDARSACSTGVTHHHPVAPLSQSSSSLSQSLTSSNCQSVRDACNSHSDIISEDAAIMSLSQSASQFSENAVAHPVQEDASRAKRPQPPSSLIPLSASSLSSSAAAVSQQQLHQQTQGSESSVIGSSFNNNNNNSSSDDTDSIKTDTTAVRSISPQPNTTVRSLRHRPATSASAQKSLSQPASPQASSSLKSESTLMTSTSLPSLSTLVAEPSSPATPSLIPCRWRGCSCELDSSDLLEHIRKHVDAQIEKKTYSCLWEDCKVFDKPSWSCSWLERHIVSHSGHRPFKCILDNCGQRFHSQVALERHVNGHFASSSQNGIKSGRTKEDISHRMLQKRKRQLNRRFVQSGESPTLSGVCMLSASAFLPVCLHVCVHFVGRVNY